ncbi:MAG: hypothetical protein RMJ15_10760 [Nitrososphaerota archaeon]|nr:hypothetical protein [Candidatus Bathyarchaeota archaeon]MDW8024189.1 hypothetical protein [Nitrososphaerota archaeon]
MYERRQKREPLNPLELNREDLDFILEPAKIEIGSAYIISLNYDEEGNPIVDIKTYGKVDAAKLRKKIERLYPNVQIRQLSHEPKVTIVRKNERRSKSRKK